MIPTQASSQLPPIDSWPPPLPLLEETECVKQLKLQHNEFNETYKKTVKECKNLFMELAIFFINECLYFREHGNQLNKKISKEDFYPEEKEFPPFLKKIPLLIADKELKIKKYKQPIESVVQKIRETPEISFDTSSKHLLELSVKNPDQAAYYLYFAHDYRRKMNDLREWGSRISDLVEGIKADLNITRGHTFKYVEQVYNQVKEGNRARSTTTEYWNKALRYIPSISNIWQGIQKMTFYSVNEISERIKKTFST